MHIVWWNYTKNCYLKKVIRMFKEFKKNTAFTVVKICISIVVIGLIIVSATVGNSILKQAQLRSIAEDISIYKSAYNNFYLKYKAIPGDMKNVYDYWGEDVGCTNENINIAEKGCNGDGNNLINANNVNDAFPYIDTKKENFKAWQFLAKSGLIPGVYAGKSDSSFIIGENIPATQYSKNVGLIFDYSSSYCSYVAHDAASCEPPTSRGNYLFIKAIDNPSPAGSSFLTTADALAITTKIDDGMPKKGKLLGYSGNPAKGTVANKCARGSYYDLSHNSKACAIMYKMNY